MRDERDRFEEAIPPDEGAQRCKAEGEARPAGKPATTTPPDEAPIAVLLTVDDVAGLLQLTPKSVYRLVEERKLPGVRRIGRRVRFYRPDLVAWMAGQESARPRRSR